VKVVVITGSRYWTRPGPITDAIQGADLVIHGCARGADELAGLAAQSEQLDELVFRAHWHDGGKAAGPARNERMALCAQKLRSQGHAVHCCAFPLEDSRGTWDCVRRMREHEVPVTVFGESEVR
jgi:hypothetical protein